MPKDLLNSVAHAQNLNGDNGTGQERMLNAVNNLDSDDAFIQAAADLPISPNIRYHSIIARADPADAVDHSSDGVVPYWSAHLSGATSEKLIRSGHSVQETAPAIIELRRILHEDITQFADGR